MDSNIFREVRFDKYCETCKYKELDEVKDPCNDCLAIGMREETEKPEESEEPVKNEETVKDEENDDDEPVETGKTEKKQD